MARSSLPTTSVVLFVHATIIYIILAIISIIAYKVKGWSYRPDIQTMLDNSKNDEYSLAEIKEWLVKECKMSFDDTQAKLKKKASLTNCILILLVVETVLLTTGLLYALFYQ